MTQMCIGECFFVKKKVATTRTERKASDAGKEVKTRPDFSRFKKILISEEEKVTISAE